MSEAWCNVCGDEPDVKCSCRSDSALMVAADRGEVVIDVVNGGSILAIVKLSPRAAVELADRIRSMAVQAEYKPR